MILLWKRVAILNNYKNPTWKLKTYMLDLSTRGATVSKLSRSFPSHQIRSVQVDVS